MKTLIYMVRHAESEGNACRRCHAQFDGIITRRGMQQAEALAERFRNIPITAIYSSDSYRSRMTAAPLAREKGLDVQYRMLLREYTIGCWEGLSIGDAAHSFPEKWERWGATPYDHDIPGADRFQTVAERGVEIIRRMAAENPGGTVVAVTHSCTLTCTLTTILKEPISYYTSIKGGDNTAVTLIEVDENANMRAMFINDDSHLPSQLRRTHYTGRSAATNMAFDSFDPASGEARLLLQYEEARSISDGAFLSKTDFLSVMYAALDENPRFVIFPMLLDRTCGLIVLSSGSNLPDDCGKVVLFYISTDLRPTGYYEQALGEAIDVLRRSGRKRLVLCATGDPYYTEMTRRFCFEPLPGFDGLLALPITVPGIDGPVY